MTLVTVRDDKADYDAVFIVEEIALIEKFNTIYSIVTLKNGKQVKLSANEYHALVERIKKYLEKVDE